jgi:hypothetical protein
MMRIKYGGAIKESEEELRKVEEHWRGQKGADRVRLFSGGHLFPLMGERQRFLDSLTETLRPGSEDPL